MGKYYQQNDDSKFDFDLSQNGFRINIEEAFKNEQASLVILDEFLSSKIEVKCQNTGKYTGNVYLEYRISKWDKEKKELKPFENSGLLVSESDNYVLTCHDMIIATPTSFLKYLYTNRIKFKTKYGTDRFNLKDSDVPYNPKALGLVVPIPFFVQLYMDWIDTPDYIQHRIKKQHK
jgi:hypothetical protein